MLGRKPTRRRDPWVVGFALSVVAVIWSFAALAFVIFNVADDDEPRVLAGEETPAAGETRQPEVRAGLTFSGELPSGAVALALVPAKPGASPDISFALGNGDDSVPV